jgi:hypothetical protein
MKNVKSFLTITAVITAMGTAALAQHMQEPQMDMQAMQNMMEDMTPKDSDAASTKAFKEAYMKMMHDCE